MAKATVSEVKQIIDTDLSDTDIQRYIDDAHSVISDVFSSDKPIIERWLTAHLMAVSRERQSTEEEVLSARARYAGKTAMGLDATLYGQQAKTLDTSGKLANSLSKRRATLTAITEEDWKDNWAT